MNAVVTGANVERSTGYESKGLASRKWSRAVLTSASNLEPKMRAA